MKKTTTQISAFAETYDSLTECFGENLPVESLSEFSGLTLNTIKALVLCKNIERSIDQLNALLINVPNVSALGFAGSGHAHILNIADDDTLFLAFENFNVFDQKIKK